MLNLTVRPGEYLQIGDEIKVVFTGGTGNNLRIMVDAPKKYNIVRNTVLERNAKTTTEKEALPKYHKEAPLSDELVAKIKHNSKQPYSRQYSNL